MKERFGRYGVWTRSVEVTAGFASGVEEAGYPALWVGGSPPDDLELIEHLLDATEEIIIATGIVNIWVTDPATLSASYHRINERHPDRFVLGIGVGHRERDGEKAVAPYGAMEDFLDGLDEHGVPTEHLLLAALGPRMLALSAERTLGAHPYMTTPTHTATAREVMGPDALLAPEQRVVLTEDTASGLDLARNNIARYLRTINYRNNLLAMGYEPSDLENEGSDRIIADLAAVGEVETVVAGLEAHHNASADHVAVQVYAESEDQLVAGLRTLTSALHLD